VAAPDALVWDIASGPQYVDPVMGTSAQASVLVVQNVYERLVWYDGANMEPIPWLASGWEITDGGQRYAGVKACPWREQGRCENTSDAKRQAAKLR
jgi:ABC-type transport system substrate-binding protein